MHPVRLIRTVAVLTAVAGLGLVTQACGNSQPVRQAELAVPRGHQTDLVRAVHGRIKGSGASFPDAFYQEAVAGLHGVAPKLSVTYEAVGSAAGREAFGQGLSDFAGTDSLVGDDDPIAAGSFRYIPSVAAPIAVVVNLPGVKDLRLTPDTLASIFQGDVTRWNDPSISRDNPTSGLPGREIVVARRADGSGTTKNFTRYLDRAAGNWRLGAGDTVEWPAHTQGGQHNSGVAQIVIDTPGSIGYVDFGNAKELDLATASIRNRSGRWVAPSVASTRAAVDASRIEDDLTYDPIDAAGAGAYPITAPTYLLVRSEYRDAAKGEAVVAFARWLMTDGADTYAAEFGFAPLPERIRSRALASLDRVRTDRR